MYILITLIEIKAWWLWCPSPFCGRGGSTRK